MLLLLTGSVQSGKTRWLTRIVDTLAARGVTPYGVLAPGRWLEPDEEGKREKVGIDNVLLPEGGRIDFATRRDLLGTDERDGEDSASRAAQLGWAIHDEAMATVNAHFDRLLDSMERFGTDGPALLAIDELGRLELARDEGLTSAVAFAERFPELVPEGVDRLGIIVVRPSLIDEAKARFTPSWGEPLCIVPDANAEPALLEAFHLA